MIELRHGCGVVGEGCKGALIGKLGEERCAVKDQNGVVASGRDRFEEVRDISGYGCHLVWMDEVRRGVDVDSQGAAVDIDQLRGRMKMCVLLVLIVAQRNVSEIQRKIFGCKF